MISSYMTTNQTVETGETIDFDINRIKTGCSVAHAAGTPTFTLTKPGFYAVSFNGVANSVAAATDPIIVQLFAGVDEVPGAISSALSATVDTPVSFSFSTVIQVRPSCPAIDNTVSLTFQNTGVDAVFTDAAVSIVKLVGVV